MAFATGALVGAVTLPTGFAHAQSYLPHMELTPYRLVSSDGLCATVGTGAANEYWTTSAAPCSESNNRQVFYIVLPGPGLNFVDYAWQTQPPGAPAPALVVLADTYDLVRNGMISKLVYDGRVSNFFGSSWFIKQVPTTSTWTTVGISMPGFPTFNFAVAGQRTFQYKTSDGQGQPLYRTVQGIDPGINATGVCSAAWFGGSLPGATKLCQVEGPARRDTPFQVQLFNQGDSCLAYQSGNNQLFAAASCDPATAPPGVRSVWSLVPAKYPQ